MMVMCVYILTINFVGIVLHTSAKIHEALRREMLNAVLSNVIYMYISCMVFKL